MSKTFQVTLGRLLDAMVWMAALTLAILIAVVGAHVLIIGGLTVYHLMHS
jgi:hypothetical protein